jgi:hypothetical protein
LVLYVENSTQISTVSSAVKREIEIERKGPPPLTKRGEARLPNMQHERTNKKDELWATPYTVITGTNERGRRDGKVGEDVCQKHRIASMVKPMGEG